MRNKLNRSDMHNKYILKFRDIRHYKQKMNHKINKLLHTATNLDTRMGLGAL